MKSFLLVFAPDNYDFEYKPFLSDVASEAKKQEGIERLSENVYMIPEDKFLAFVSRIALLMANAQRKGLSVCKYKCLTFEETPQWIHFVGFPQ